MIKVAEVSSGLKLVPEGSSMVQAWNSRDDGGWTPLARASLKGHLDVVRLLLQNGATAESRDNDGSTPLIFASGEGHLDVVHLLLQSGATVDSRNNYGWTPLAPASQNGHADVVRLLLQSGAAVDSSPKDSWSQSSGASGFPSQRLLQFHHHPTDSKSREPRLLHLSSFRIP